MKQLKTVVKTTPFYGWYGFYLCACFKTRHTSQVSGPDVQVGVQLEHPGWTIKKASTGGLKTVNLAEDPWYTSDPFGFSPFHRSFCLYWIAIQLHTQIFAFDFVIKKMYSIREQVGGNVADLL